ncbi:MAG: DNA-binding response regulator [Firmicutes bacterium HGW-Firmicutes-21]|nr:MAG: DNA-binding response regulator [Firmicutes bacterium HGW-Firmicutes-21]
MRVLIVEDEIRLADTLGEIMHTQKYTYDIVYNGSDGLAYGESNIYDVIILDIMLPNMNGFEVVKNLRNKKIKTPVILLTARDDISDKIKGLDFGADDYLTKPFSSEELLARIRAVSRRKGEVVLDELEYADLKLNLTNYLILCGDKSLHLGFKEFEIMRIIMSNTAAVVAKEVLLTKVWGYDSDAEDNNVEVYISFLRKKLQFLGSRVGITTVRKIGYYLEESV